MSYTFGAATSDDITTTTVLQLGATNVNTFVAGWWYPTTLTSTRGYWSGGNTFGAEVDSTTSQIRFRTQNGTTNGQWTTSGTAITTGKWWYLAFLNSNNNTGAAAAWRCWIGDAESAPVEQTVTVATTPSGNFTGNANAYLGNKGTGTLAFQGDIGWATFVSSNTSIVSVLPIAVAGAISNGEAQIVHDQWVYPLWRGIAKRDYPYTACDVRYFDLRDPSVYRFSHGTTVVNDMATATVNGATVATSEPPTRPIFNWPNVYPLRRR